jgi:hypothetical protein
MRNVIRVVVFATLATAQADIGARIDHFEKPGAWEKETRCNDEAERGGRL